MKLKVALNFPLHFFNTVWCMFAPRALFINRYKMSSDTVREQELYIRNKARLCNYYAKRWISNE